MNCKRCGKEIVGEIQRYCNDCKRELKGQSRVDETSKTQRDSKKVELAKQIKEQPGKFSKELKQVEQTKKTEKALNDNVQTENKKEKKSRIFSFGYVLLIIVMMLVAFLISVVIGFSIGPVLPI